MIRLDAVLASVVPEATRSGFCIAQDGAEAAKVSANLVTDLSVIASIPFKTRGMFQIGLRRSIELADGFAAAFNAKLYAPLFVLARASVETGTLMWDFWTRLAGILLKKDKTALRDFDERMIKAMLGRKARKNNEPPEYEAPNVLTMIDRQTKELDGLADLYASLSEIAHPNHDGMLALYCSDRKEGQDFIDWPFYAAPPGLGAAVHAATLGLKQSAMAAQSFEEFGVGLVELCEEMIHDEGRWPSGISYPVPR